MKINTIDGLHSPSFMQLSCDTLATTNEYVYVHVYICIYVEQSHLENTSSHLTPDVSSSEISSSLSSVANGAELLLPRPSHLNKMNHASLSLPELSVYCNDLKHHVKSFQTPNLSYSS